MRDIYRYLLVIIVTTIGLALILKYKNVWSFHNITIVVITICLSIAILNIKLIKKK